MQVRALLETALYTDDLPELERFYADVLGLEPIARTEGRNSAFRCGHMAVILFNRAASSTEGGPFPPHGCVGGGHVAFVMQHEAELHAWRQHLSDHGITIEREVTWPEGGVSVYFRDPAGNSIELAPGTIWNGLGRQLLAGIQGLTAVNGQPAQPERNVHPTAQ